MTKVATLSRPFDRLGDIPRGIIAMILASLFLAIASAITKFEVALYPTGEVLFVRSFASLIVGAAFVLPRTGLAVFDTNILGAHAARGLSQSVSQAFTVLALGLMPLSSTIAINFSAPLWAALISVLWLRERPGPQRLAFLGVGFVGVMIVAMPGTSTLQLGSLFALANAVMYGSVTVAVRRMTKTESWQTLLMWQLLLIAALHSTLLVFGCEPIAPRDWMLLVASGLANGIGQILWTRALQLAPASAVSPFYYTMLAWAMIIGFLMWGDIPSIGLVIGSLIVVSSGLLLLWHEARKSAPGALALRRPERA
jgi:drug/metabolite transporter (DMT)-like permease